MKKKAFFTFQLLMIFFFSIDVRAQETQEKAWIPLTQLIDLFQEDTPIYGIKIDTKKASRTNLNILAIFTDGKNEIVLNSGAVRGLFDFGDGFKWSFSVKKKNIKLEKKNKDDFIGNINFAKYKIGPVRIKEIQKNFLVDNVYVQVEKNCDYYLSTNQPELAIQNVQNKAENGDIKSMDLCADLLLKYGNNYERNKAFSWYKKSLDNGNEHAIVGMAKCYLEGVGVEKDTTKAEALLMMSDYEGVDSKYLSYCIYKNRLGWYFKDGFQYTDFKSLTEELVKLECAPVIADYIVENSYLFKGRGEGYKLLKMLYKSQDAELINRTIKEIYTRTEPPYGHKTHGWADFRGEKYSNVEERIIKRLLKSGDCDCLWLPVTGVRVSPKDDETIEIYGGGKEDYWTTSVNIPLFVWDLLDCSNSSWKERHAKLIDKYCDIALETTDKKLYETLFYAIISLYSYNYDRYEERFFMSLYDLIDYLKDVKHKSTRMTLHAERQIQKIIATIKKGSDLGIEQCSSYYEKLYLKGIVR